MATHVQILLLVLSAPLWAPLLRALWLELNEALVREGGLLGGWRVDRPRRTRAGGPSRGPGFDHRPEQVSARPRGLGAGVRTRRLSR